MVPNNACAYINGPAAEYKINKLPHALAYHWGSINNPGMTITHPNGLGVNDTVVLVLSTAISLPEHFMRKVHKEN